MSAHFKRGAPEIPLDVKSEDECFAKCQELFCHGYVYNDGKCVCLLCTGPLMD